VSQVSQNQLQQILTVARQGSLATIAGGLGKVDKAVDQVSSLLHALENSPANATHDVSPQSDPSRVLAGTEKTSIQKTQELGERIQIAVRAELDKQGLTGLGSRWLNDSGPTSPFMQIFTNAVRGTDPATAIVNKMAENPLDGFIPGNFAVGGFDVKGAQEVLSVPGLERFKGPDIFSLKNAKDAAGGIASAEPTWPKGKINGEYYQFRSPEGSFRVVERGNHLAVDVSGGLQKEISQHQGDRGTTQVNVKDANGVLAKVFLKSNTFDVYLRWAPKAGTQETQADKDKHPKYEGTRYTVDPKTKVETQQDLSTKKYESPDGPLIPREPVNFDPDKKLNGLRLPGTESEPDMSTYVDRLARGIVAGLMSKINPNPNGPLVEGGQDGSVPAKLGGILGGDPPSSDPTVSPTRPKGPKPLGMDEGPEPVLAATQSGTPDRTGAEMLALHGFIR